MCSVDLQNVIPAIENEAASTPEWHIVLQKKQCDSSAAVLIAVQG